MNTTLRKTIKNIDSRFFADTLRKLNRLRWTYTWYIKSKTVRNAFKFNTSMYFTCKKQNYLGELFDKYGSDKGYYLHGEDQNLPKSHCYNDLYNLLFFLHKNQTKLVLECGVGTQNPAIASNMTAGTHNKPGGSLRAWRDYFPNAQIIGIDIDPDIMFTENRISTYVCDQTSKQSINDFIYQSNLQPNTVDIIIDDGLHEFNANISLFENTKYLLKDNGIYVIEDVSVIKTEQQKFIDYFRDLDGYNTQFVKIFSDYLIIITKKDV